MIKTITIINHFGEEICLELSNPYDSGFVVKNITGLGPVNANVNFTELATIDGAIDNDSERIGSRNIVMELEFLEHPTIEDTRLLSYKYFPIKKNVTFIIETDSRTCKTIGRIEKNDPEIFSDKEGCQVSILCPDPYFYSVKGISDKKEILYGVEPLFEFPFQNPSLDENLIEFGSIKKEIEHNIFYDGDEDIGVKITIDVIGDAEGISIYSLREKKILIIDDNKFQSLMGDGIKAGDEIVIDTTKNHKSIVLLRNGVTTNIINVLGRPIQWFQIMKGNNNFLFRAVYGLSNLTFTIENDVIYEGV